MKKHIFLFLSAILLLTNCTESVTNIEHKGHRLLTKEISNIDTTLIQTDSISWNGNFFVASQNLWFADTYYCQLFEFDWNTGKLIGKHLRKGQAKNEVTDIMYAYTPKNNNNNIYILTSSLYMYIYNIKNNKIEYQQIINFDKEHTKLGDYESPSVYNIMEMSDFGVDIYELSPTRVLFPLSFENRKLNGVDATRYNEGHIWGEYDIEKHSFTQLTGNYPNFYKQNPLPCCESFSYTMNQSDCYYNFFADSLIYVCEYPDKPKFTFGFDGEQADRSYTNGYNDDAKYIKDDLTRVSVNSGINYIKETKQLVRTICNKLLDSDITTTIQIYDTNTFDLIAEKTIPGCFQFKHYSDGNYYGINPMPCNDNKNFIYKFSLK